MIKKRKRLYIFRALLTNEVGLVRAYCPDEAIDLVMQHYGQSIEMWPVPRNFSFFMPRF